MGWDSTHYDKHAHDGLVEFFYGKRTPGTNEYVDPHYGTVTEVAAHGLVRRSEWYAVIRWRNAGKEWGDPGTCGWFCAVSIVKFSRGQYNICYKQMEEDMGPSIASAPLKVLEALERLDPLSVLSDEAQAEIARLKPLADYDHKPYSDPERREADRQWAELDPRRTARVWRARCWQQVNTRKAAPKVKVGDVIRFENPITLTIGKVQEFRIGVGRFGKGIRLYTLWDIPCRIGNWRDMPYSIQIPQEVA